MKDVYDYAKYFIRNNKDSFPDTFDGNMKLQKLLTFANLISISEYNENLFGDKILAYKNGCVIEKIRLRFKNDYISFMNDSALFQPDFSEREYTILNLVNEIFGKSSARELSAINHEFNFWKFAFEKSKTNIPFYYDKEKAVVDMKSNKEDIETMKDIIEAYKETALDKSSKEVINGIAFYYDDMELTDEIYNYLEEFSLSAEDDAYTIYKDGEALVVY